MFISRAGLPTSLPASGCVSPIARGGRLLGQRFEAEEGDDSALVSVDGEDGVGDEAAEEGGGFAGFELEEFGAGAGMGAEGGEGLVAA